MYNRRRRHSISFVGILILLVIFALLLSISIFLKNLATQIAISDATDIVTETVNNSINEVIGNGVYGFDYFVSLEKDSKGDISAITSNMAHINTLSTEILNKVISSTENGTITVKIPLGNLSGINLLMGKGPDVKVDIVMLTSSKVDFKNEIYSTGINQTKYQLYLDVSIDIDILVPWGTKSATTVTEVLVADTVIVGKVPDTYLNMEN